MMLFFSRLDESSRPMCLFSYVLSQFTQAVISVNQLTKPYISVKLSLRRNLNLNRIFILVIINLTEFQPLFSFSLIISIGFCKFLNLWFYSSASELQSICVERRITPSLAAPIVHVIQLRQDFEYKNIWDFEYKNI